uniref:Uncharacterized protein n=1 Tax=Siphoviridae sp. ctAUQ2 TaxID=2826182 RepID=A0A8S5MZT6_9CAUD|nr:MAG TPA: hypothetical protein [Siphoviridae sp. ctAUQ2]
MNTQLGTTLASLRSGRCNTSCVWLNRKLC